MRDEKESSSSSSCYCLPPRSLYTSHSLSCYALVGFIWQAKPSWSWSAKLVKSSLGNNNKAIISSTIVQDIATQTLLQQLGRGWIGGGVAVCSPLYKYEMWARNSVFDNFETGLQSRPLLIDCWSWFHFTNLEWNFAAKNRARNVSLARDMHSFNLAVD